MLLTAAMLEGWTPDCPLAASWVSNAFGVSHSFGRHLGTRYFEEFLGTNYFEELFGGTSYFEELFGDQIF